MNQEKKKKDSLAKLRRTFLRMSSPQGFDGQEKKRRGTIVSMNVPPLLGKAGATYDAAVRLLTPDLPVTQDETTRAACYAKAKSLFETAAAAMSEAGRSAAADKLKLDLGPFCIYMEFLLENLATLVRIAEGQAKYLTLDKSVFFSGSAGILHGLCVEDELRRYHFLLDTIHAHEPALAQQRELVRNKLSKSDNDRMELAYSRISEFLSPAEKSASE